MANSQTHEKGDVAIATVRGKVRLLRYLPNKKGDTHPWVMDQTYNDGDYIQSNWTGDESQLIGFQQVDPPKPYEPTGLGAVVEASCVHNDIRRRWLRSHDQNWYSAHGKPDDFDSLIDVAVIHEGVQ